MKQTPLHAAHLAAGAKMAPFAGWEMPISYEGIREEHLAVRTHAGMFDVSHMGEVEAEGPEAAEFLQRVLSNDISPLPIGGAQYSCLCNEHGGVVDDLIAYRLAKEHFLIVTNAANHGSDLRWMARWIGDYDCVLRDVADRWAMLAVQGPHAREIVAGALGVSLPERMQVLATVIDGAPGVACGTGYTGEDGVELLIDPGRAPMSGHACSTAASSRPASGRATPCGSRSASPCTATTSPWSATRSRPGSAGAARSRPGSSARSRSPRCGPPARRGSWPPFTIEGAGIPRQGNGILAGGEPVGEVTSGSFSPSLELGIGMGYVRADLAEPGAELEIDVRGKQRAARIGSKPLYRKDL